MEKKHSLVTHYSHSKSQIATMVTKVEDLRRSL